MRKNPKNISGNTTKQTRLETRLTVLLFTLSLLLSAFEGFSTSSATLVAGTLVLNEGDNSLHSAVIDTVNGAIYFGTDGRGIVRVRLSDFTRSGALYPEETSDFYSAVIDTISGFAYFGATGPPVYLGYPQTRILKIRVSDFALVQTLVLDEGLPLSAVIDTVNGFVYFGIGAEGGGASRIVKVRLSDFTRAGTLTLEPSEGVNVAVIDPDNGFAYFGSGSHPATIAKVRLLDFTRVGALRAFW